MRIQNDSILVKQHHHYRSTKAIEMPIQIVKKSPAKKKNASKTQRRNI